MPDTSVKEARERVRTAIKNSNVDFLSKKIIVNLAPADTKKEGSSYDLPIAIGILISMEEIHNANIDNMAFIGELSLDGKLNKVNGVLPMCIEARRLGIKQIVVPEENAKEAGIVSGIEVLPAKNLLQVMNFLNKEEDIKPIEIKIESFFEQNRKYNVDFSEVKGQENIKRAMEVAAAGSHNFLLIGSPGSRKNNACKKTSNNIARFKEALEITKIHSIAGILKQDVPLISTRPFRAPHHTVSGVSLVGGGRIPKPRRNKSSTLWSIIFRRTYRISQKYLRSSTRTFRR